MTSWFPNPATTQRSSRKVKLSAAGRADSINSVSRQPEDPCVQVRVELEELIDKAKTDLERAPSLGLDDLLRGLGHYADSPEPDQRRAYCASSRFHKPPEGPHPECTALAAELNALRVELHELVLEHARTPEALDLELRKAARQQLGNTDAPSGTLGDIHREVLERTYQRILTDDWILAHAPRYSWAYWYDAIFRVHKDFVMVPSSSLVGLEARRITDAALVERDVDPKVLETAMTIFTKDGISLSDALDSARALED